MARIRSVYPGLFTDEGFVSLSMPARLFLIGTWNECDDFGVFEWKPIVLKMRLFPADNVDPVAILNELKSAQFVTSFTVDHRNYGVVRNFCKFQHPKKPIHKFPFLKEFRTWIGLKYGNDEQRGKWLHPSSTLVLNQSGNLVPNGDGDGSGDGNEEKKKDPNHEGNTCEVYTGDDDQSWLNGGGSSKRRSPFSASPDEGQFEDDGP